MKLRLPHKFQAALMAALASVSFTTLSTGTIAAAGVAFFGHRAAAQDATDDSTGINIGYADLNEGEVAGEDAEEIIGDQSATTPIVVGSNGGVGNNDGLLLNEDNSSDEIAFDAGTSGNPASTTSGTADTIPADDLGFTSNSYDTGAEAFNGSDEVFQMPTAAPAMQQVQEETPTQKNTTSTGTTTTAQKSLLGTSVISLGGGFGSPVGTSGGYGTTVLASAPLLGNAGNASSIVFEPDGPDTTAGTVTAGSWSKHYASTFTRTSETAVSATDVAATLILGGRLTVKGNDNASNLSAHGGDIVVGNNGQLFLQTWDASDISLANKILIGSSTDGTYGTIRFGNDGNKFSTTLSGGIYLIEDAAFWADANKTDPENAINITGIVTDLVPQGAGGVVRTNSTLTIKQGKLYHFNTIDLSGLTLNSGVVMDTANLAADSIAVNGTLTAGSLAVAHDTTFTGSGSVVLGTERNTVSLSGASILTINGPTVTINGTNKDSFSGNIEVVSGTLKLGDSNTESSSISVLGSINSATAGSRTITIGKGGTLDINGKVDNNYVYTLAGGTLTNTGAGIGNNSSQTVGLSLTDNSYVGDTEHTSQFWLRNRGSGTTTLSLDSYTLTKQGSSTFGLYATTVTGTGAINVAGGTLEIQGGTFGANLVLSGGNVTGGTMTLDNDITIDATAEGSVSAVIAGSHSITKTGTGTLTLSGNNTFSGGLTVNKGTLATSNTNALGSGNVSISEGSTLEMRSSLTIGGTLSGAGDITYTGANAGTVTLNADYGGTENFTGVFTNTGAGAVTLSIPNASKGGQSSLIKFDIVHAQDAGVVNLAVSTASALYSPDLHLYGTAEVNNITHRTTVSTLLHDNADVTATGTVLTGRLVVGETSNDAATVFTLSGANAQLYDNNGTEHTYTATVQGYGTFEVADGATQTLSKLNALNQEFHGTLKATGANSALTLNSALGSGTDLVAENGGKIVLTSSVTGADTVTIGSGSTLQLANKSGDSAITANNLTLASGSILDLSSLGISGTETTPITLIQGGTIDETYLSSVDIKFAQGVTPESYTLSKSGNNLVLTFTQPDLGLIWDGTQNSNWSTSQADTNWHAYGEEPGSSYFSTGSKVTFESAANPTNTAVLQEDIAAGTMTVQSGANVTLHTDPRVARSLETMSLAVGDGATLTVDANLTLTTGTITGNGTISVQDCASLELTDGVTSENTINVGGGSIVKLAGTGEDVLAVKNLKLGDVSILDVSNIVIPEDKSSVKIADISGRLDFHSRTSGSTAPSGHYVNLVALANYQGDPTDVVYLSYTGTEHQEGGIYYFTDAELYLVKEAPGLYWNNRDENGNLIGGVWQPKQETRGVAGIANWNTELVPDTTTNPNVVTETSTPLYFITETPDQEITILVDRAYEASGEKNNMQASTIVVGGGGTFNFVREDSTGGYGINQNSNVPSALIVRSGTTAHFELDIKSGEYAQVLVETGAQLDLFDATGSAGGPNEIYNQGLFNMSFPGYMYAQRIVNAGTANIGRVWDEEGKVIIESTEEPFSIFAEKIYNEAGATMTLAGEFIIPKDVISGASVIDNEGELIFRTDDTMYDMGVTVSIPIEGMGAVTTVGTDSATFSSTVDGSMLNTGAKSTDFGARVTITDTTTLTAEDFAEDEDKSSTTTFNYSSQLGEHVVMGANTTLDLTPGYGASADYTMGEVTSTTAEAQDQEFIVRSGVTADVAGNVSLPDGKAQIAGGGKLTIGGATSTVGELAATGGGTAVVELNGATAGTVDDLVLNATKLSNANGTTLQVVNTETGTPGRVAAFNIGDAEAAEPASSYQGTLQYGVGAGAASDSGMNLTIKDNNVAAGAVLEAYYDANAPANGSVNIIVNTDHAMVVGLSDNINGPDANRAMVVSGTEGANNMILEITGDSTYTYAGKLGENLDVTYSGDGSQTIEGGVSGFNGKVTVDNGSAQAGVLALLNATSVEVTDVTLGANDKLGVYKGSTATGTIANDGKVTMTSGHTLTAGKGAAMDAVLEMESGSTLDVSASAGTAGLLMGGSVTLNPKVTLSGSDMEKIMGMSFMDSYDLFSGVQAFSYDGSTPSSEAITFTSDWVKASDVFSNDFQGKDYYVFYSGNARGGQGGNVGAVYIMQIPEPTTGTLSLLALCALAARRRRK